MTTSNNLSPSIKVEVEGEEVVEATHLRREVADTTNSIKVFNRHMGVEMNFPQRRHTSNLTKVAMVGRLQCRISSHLHPITFLHLALRVFLQL